MEKVQSSTFLFLCFWTYFRTAPGCENVSLSGSKYSQNREGLYQKLNDPVMTCSGRPSYIQIESYHGYAIGDYLFYEHTSEMSGWFVGPRWCYYLQADIRAESSADHPAGVGNVWQETRNWQDWEDSPGLRVQCSIESADAAARDPYRTAIIIFVVIGSAIILTSLFLYCYCKKSPSERRTATSTAEDTPDVQSHASAPPVPEDDDTSSSPFPDVPPPSYEDVVYGPNYQQYCVSQGTDNPSFWTVYKPD